MSRHWRPDEDLARLIAADELARSRKAKWPEGATVGVLALAASCLAVGLVLYQVASPREVIDESVARR